nr:hypothetical protein [Nostoc sp. PCC 7120 = FACHB-418]
MANERLLLLPKTIKLFDFGEGCDRTCWYFEGDTSGGTPTLLVNIMVMIETAIACVWWFLCNRYCPSISSTINPT